MTLSGYFLIVSIMGLFFAENTNSQNFTITYRLFMLIFSIAILSANIKRHIYIPKATRIYILFFSLFLFRALYDLFLNPNIEIISSEINRFLSFTLLIIIIPSITLIYTVKYINLNKAFYQVLSMLSFSLLISYFSIEEIIIDQRLGLANGLGVITTGHLATLQIILTLFSLKNKMIKNLFFKALIVFTFFVSLRILFLSGSRGPFLNLILVLFLMNLKLKNFKYYLILVAVLILFSSSLISFFLDTVPIFANRVLNSQNIGGREFIYIEALEIIKENPFFGKQFALIQNFGEFIYCHNLILDSMISLGLIGLILVLFTIKNIVKYSYNIIKFDSKHSWVAILLVMELLQLLVSSSFYQNERFTYLIIIVFTFKNIKNKLNENTYFITKTS